MPKIINCKNCNKEISVKPSAVHRKYCSIACRGMGRRGWSGPALKHGMYKNPLYKTWNSMKYRCNNEKSRDYINYGGRGITICERWLTSFEFFYNDMNKTYKKGLTLERINNNGNYEPSNCRWITNGEQSNNKRNNVLITYRGRTQNMGQWANELNLEYWKLNYKLRIKKLSPEAAISELTRGN